MTEQEKVDVPAMKLSIGAIGPYVVCFIGPPDKDPENLPEEERVELLRVLRLSYEASIDVREQFEKLCNEAATSLFRKFMRDKGMPARDYELVTKEVE